MKIFFFGENKKVSNEEFVKMAKFFVKLLLKKKERKNLILNISFEKDDKMKHAYAYVQHMTKDEYFIWIHPKSSIKKQIKSLAHELVHVKQFVKGEVDKTNLVILSNALKGMQTESSDYWDNPMEIEAFGRTPGLYRRYMESLGERNDMAA